MEFVYNLLVVLHFIGLASLLGGFIVQMKSPDKGVNPAMLHGALTQLVTGVLLVGIASAGLVPGEEVDHAKIAVKLVIVLIITALAFVGLGDPAVTSWGQMVAAGFAVLGLAWWVWVWPAMMLVLVSGLVAVAAERREADW